MATYPELAGKTVLVTGGANGIGEATVRAFHDQGARVHFCDIDAVAGRKLGKALGNVRFERVDLTSEPQIKHWVAKIRRQEKAINVLVNNAAADPRIPFAETSSKAWDELFARNLRAYFVMAREAAGGMSAGASIINLASIGGMLGVRDRVAYCASKFAVVGLTKSMALDHAAEGVRINCICPARVETPFVSARLKEYPDPEKAFREMSATQPVGRMARPEEIAHAALYLASDEAAFLTGTAFVIDGGFSAGR